MIATTLQRIPVLRTDRDWLVTVEDDGCYGFHFTAARCGCLWASGYVRTRSQSTALVIARQTGAATYAASILDPQETP